MKRVSCSLVVLGLFLRVAGQAEAEFTYTTLDVPGSAVTQANGINDAGQIVGYYDAGGTSHGFLLSGGVYTILDVPGAALTNAFGINASGRGVLRGR
jgi:probable HAF family extracellular repeat protein